MATATERYNAARRNQATMRQVESLMLRETEAVLNVGRDYDRQTFGGLVRTALPVIVDKYGRINAVAAMKYYDEQRLAALSKATLLPGPANRSGRNAARSRAERFAAARLRSQIYVATMPAFNVAEKTSPIIGWTMSVFAENGFDAASAAAKNAMTRAVASYNRDTMLYNSALDPDVRGVQRIAEVGACSFCRLMAFASTKGSGGRLDVRVGSYAADFHNSCRCSIETLYDGDEPVRPAYYDQFEAQYEQATNNVGTSSARDVISEMAKIGRQTSG